MDKATLTKKIIEVLGSAYDNASFYRFNFCDSWRDNPTFIYDAFISALQEHKENEANDTPEEFQRFFISEIEAKMEALDMIQSHEDMARQLIQECFDELFNPERFHDDGATPEYRYQIAEMEEDEIIEILTETIADEDTSSFLDEVKNMNVKIRFLYSPNYEGIDESFNYGSNIGEFRCDENLETALRFFNVTPSQLKDIMEKQGYEASDEFLKLKDFTPSETSLATPERLTLMLENTYRYWLPCCIFNVELSELLNFAPGKKVTVKGGDVVCFDILNGSGHGELMEDDCELSFTIDNPKELLNCCIDSKLAKLHDSVFGVVQSVFNAEITVSE